eukprot:jgi/Botrbrau1/16251/Bobra.0066s0036.1
MHKDALQEIDRAVTLEPNNAVILRSRGEVKTLLGLYGEALQDLDRADTLKPNDAVTLWSRGLTKTAMAIYKEALQDLDRADTLEPNNPLTLLSRGETKRALGMHEEAQQDLDRASPWCMLANALSFQFCPWLIHQGLRRPRGPWTGKKARGCFDCERLAA